MAARSSRSEQVAQRKRARFLEFLRDGQTVKRAAAAAKIPCRTAYDWRKRDPEFAAEWDDAWEQGADLLEEVALDRAVAGSDLLTIFLLKGRRPHRYRDNVRHEIDAKLTVSVADARQELERRLLQIEDHRRQALPAPPAIEAARERRLRANGGDDDPAS